MGLEAVFTKKAAAPSSPHIALLYLLAFMVSFASSIAWKVSDVDFAKKLGSEYLVNSYLLTAALLFLGASTGVSMLRKAHPQTIFFRFQKFSIACFSAVTFAEVLCHISKHSSVVFAFKVFGYAHSSLILYAFWAALNLHDKRSTVTTGQCTLLCFSTYVGIATAGILLQSSTVGASQFGVIGAGCSLACLLLGKIAFESPHPQSIEKEVPVTTTSQTLFKAVCSSRSVLLLVLGSVLLNVLISSTEYSVIADFESRFMDSPESSKGNQTIGSFVALIGVGNMFTLFSSQICINYNLGRFGLSLATIVAFLVLRFGFTDGTSLISSAFAFVVVESLYPIVVESNLSRLLDYFPEHQQISARTFMDSLTEPAGLILSALLLSMSWVGVCSLGIGVIIVSLLITIFSYTIEGKWMAYFSNLRRQRFVFATRISAFLVFCQAIIPWVEHAEEIAESLWIHEIEWIEPPF